MKKASHVTCQENVIASKNKAQPCRLYKAQKQKLPYNAIDGRDPVSVNR